MTLVKSGQSVSWLLLQTNGYSLESECGEHIALKYYWLLIFECYLKLSTKKTTSCLLIFLFYPLSQRKVTIKKVNVLHSEDLQVIPV